MVREILQKVGDYFKQFSPNRDEFKPDKQKESDSFDILNAQSWNPTTGRGKASGSKGPSTWVQDIHYNNKNGEGQLDVTFRDGFTARYNNIGPGTAKDFANSSSKGRWVHQNLKGKPYEGV